MAGVSAAQKQTGTATAPGISGTQQADRTAFNAAGTPTTGQSGGVKSAWSGSVINQDLAALQKRVDDTNKQLQQYNTGALSDDQLRQRATSDYTPIYNAQVAEQQALKNSAKSVLEERLSALGRQYDRNAAELGSAYENQLVANNNQMLARGMNSSSLAMAMANRIAEQRQKALQSLQEERSANETAAQNEYGNAVSAADAAIARLGSDLATNIDARYQQYRNEDMQRVTQAQQLENERINNINRLAIEIEGLRQQGYNSYLNEQEQAANQALNQARLGNEQAQLAMQQRELGLKERAQEYSERMGERQQGFNEEMGRSELGINQAQLGLQRQQQAYNERMGERQQTFNEQMGRASQALNERQQGYTERMGERQQSFNEQMSRASQALNERQQGFNEEMGRASQALNERQQNYTERMGERQQGHTEEMNRLNYGLSERAQKLDEDKFEWEKSKSGGSGSGSSGSGGSSASTQTGGETTQATSNTYLDWLMGGGQQSKTTGSGAGNGFFGTNGSTGSTQARNNPTGTLTKVLGSKSPLQTKTETVKASSVHGSSGTKSTGNAAQKGSLLNTMKKITSKAMR